MRQLDFVLSAESERLNACNIRIFDVVRGRKTNTVTNYTLKILIFYRTVHPLLQATAALFTRHAKHRATYLKKI